MVSCRACYTITPTRPFSGVLLDQFPFKRALVPLNACIPHRGLAGNFHTGHCMWCEFADLNTIAVAYGTAVCTDTLLTEQHLL